MIVHLNGEFETVDYVQNRSVLLYDNIDNEEYPKHWHNAIEIIMPLTNGFEAICGGVDYKLEERDILIIPSGTLHTLKAQVGRRLILLCDNMSFVNNPALSELFSVMSDPILINKEYSHEFLSSAGNLIKDIYVLYSNFNEVSEVYIYIKVLTLLARIKEYQLSRVKYDDGGKYSDTFSVILRYIDQNYMNDITLEDLSSLAGYSTYHFSRIFKKYSNTTFINFLNRRRVKAAEMMLLESGNSITDVAMKVGFSSLTTFNRVFKSINGYTPSEYKKLYRMSHTTEGLTIK
ncbi:MAG: AraC family transcriptional regulator [Oscillospiraceae bacterium]|nr:AraC family transcriptional regulator [Oscillospiraceae bacterium]